MELEVDRRVEEAIEATLAVTQSELPVAASPAEAKASLMTLKLALKAKAQNHLKSSAKDGVEAHRTKVTQAAHVAKVIGLAVDASVAAAGQYLEQERRRAPATQ